MRNATDRNGFVVKCDWVISTPDACAACALNPGNKPARSAHLLYLFRLHALQQAGAIFYYRDLTVKDWDGLIALKGELTEWERKQWNKK